MLCSICRTSTLLSCPLCETPYCGDVCADKDWYVGEHYKHHAEHVADEVLPGVWLGSAYALEDPDFMDRICAVLSIITEDSLSTDYIQAHLQHGQAHMRIPVHDVPDAPLWLYLDAGAAFIDEHKDCGVLVHCRAGISRSATVLAYYLKHYAGYDDPLTKIRESRPAVQPNPGFLHLIT